MQQDSLDAVPTLLPASPECEVLFELFTGNSGAVQLGRFLKGCDAGRLVALRRLSESPSPDLAAATDLARSIAHPSLAKLLGHIRCGNVWYLASEQISGVTLFELGRAVTERRSPLDVAVAARIVLEALKAADVAQRLLLETANISGVRCLYPESIWIAEYGEVFVSELLVAPILAEAAAAASPPSVPPLPLSAPRADARSATVELLRLICEETTAAELGLANRSDLPPQLRSVLFDDEASAGFTRYDTLGHFIAALSALPKGLLATDQQVSAELRLVMGHVLERRRQKLDMLERFSLQPKEDDATRVFRVALKGDEVDTRPPPSLDPERTMIAPASALLADTGSDLAANEPSAERTKVFGSVAPRAATINARALETSGAEESAEAVENTVSAVWRQAEALLDSSARRPARRGLVAQLEPVSPATSGTSAGPTHPAAAVASENALTKLRPAGRWLGLLVVVAAAAAFGLAVLTRASRNAPPKAPNRGSALQVQMPDGSFSR